MNVSRFIALFCDCFSLFEGPSFFISKLSRSNRSYCLFGLIYEMQKFSTEIKSVLRRVLQALKYWLVLYQVIVTLLQCVEMHSLTSQYQEDH